MEKTTVNDVNELSKSEVKTEKTVYTYSKRFLLVIAIAFILLGWEFTFLVWGNNSGLGTTIFMTSFILLSFFISKKIFDQKLIVDYKELNIEKLPKTWLDSYKPVYYFPVILGIYQIFLSLAFLYRIEIVSYSLIWLFFVFSIPLYLGSLYFPLYPKTMTWLYAFIYLIKYAIFGIIESLKFIVEGPSLIFPFLKRKIVLKLIIAIIFALFFSICIFGSIFASADPYFKDLYTKFWDNLGDFIRSLELFQKGRIFLIFLTPLGIAGIFMVFLKYSISNIFELKLQKWQELLKDKEETIRSLSDMLINLIVIGTISLVFWIFSFVQIKYAFLGSEQVLERYTYAEFAQSGTGWLLFAIVLVYPIITFFSNRLNFQDKIYKWLTTLLNLSLIAPLFIIIFSAYRKMNLYFDAYGYSLRRVIVILGLFVTLFVLVSYISLVIYKTISNKTKEFRFLLFREYMLLAVFGALMLFTLTVMIPWPILVHKFNLIRYQNTGKIDVLYLKNAPDEVSPVIYNFVVDLDNGAIKPKDINDQDKKQTLIILKSVLEQRLDKSNKEIVIYKERNNQGSERKVGSRLNKIGALNVLRYYNAYTLHNNFYKKFGNNSKQDLKNEFNQFLQNYFSTLEQNDFIKARTYWDSTFNPISTIEFENNVRITKVNYEHCLSYNNDLSVSYADYKINYNIYNEQSKKLNDDLDLGIRDGKIVIKHSSNLPLSYQNYKCYRDVYGKCKNYYTGSDTNNKINVYYFINGTYNNDYNYKVKPIE